MNSKIKAHGSKLAKILQSVDDLSEDVAEARDLLVDELVEDRVLINVAQAFRSLAKNNSQFINFDLAEEEAFLNYQSENHPDSISVEDAPYTTVFAKIYYNGNDITANIKKQNIVRRGGAIQNTPYEAFTKCFFSQRPKTLETEDFMNAENKEREIENLVDSLLVDLKEETRGYFVKHEETNEVVKSKLTEREVRNLTKEDF